ncbi:MAG: hypothetical protein LBH97_02055 [Treponema sp.]|jgi:hypothetical protein|nr:hypothetical protein [Treponema sp.]
MKQLFIFVSALLLALALLSCPSESEKVEEETFTLDERLIGGRWFEYAFFPPGYGYLVDYYLHSPGYYEFRDTTPCPSMIAENTKLVGALMHDYSTIYFYGTIDYIGTGDGDKLYSKDGDIYWYCAERDITRKLMKYEFHDEYPYPGYLLRDEYYAVKNRASEGNFITYSLYNQEDGTIYDDGGPYQRRFLIRSTNYQSIP